MTAHDIMHWFVSLCSGGAIYLASRAAIRHYHSIRARPRADIIPVMRRDFGLHPLADAEAEVLRHLSAGPCTMAAMRERLLPHGKIETSRIGGLLPTMERAGMIEWQSSDRRTMIANFGRFGAGILGSGTVIAITLRGREALASHYPSTDEIYRTETAR